MKLKCIKSKRYITKGKYYNVVNSKLRDDVYWIWDDDIDRGGWYDKEFFQTIEDKRNYYIETITKIISNNNVEFKITSLFSAFFQNKINI
jgi:hypothetical protein